MVLVVQGHRFFAHLVFWLTIFQIRVVGAPPREPKATSSREETAGLLRSLFGGR